MDITYKGKSLRALLEEGATQAPVIEQEVNNEIG
jgi:hypothetical protein